jgi:hypothetical protein
VLTDHCGASGIFPMCRKQTRRPSCAAYELRHRRIVTEEMVAHWPPFPYMVFPISASMALRPALVRFRNKPWLSAVIFPTLSTA